jgi:hypothetical protein
MDGSKTWFKELLSTVQEGVLSPLVFVLYMSDLEDLLKQSEATTYADDTGTYSSGQNIEEVVPKLEHDAEEVLKFMASNGLIANALKTTLIILNNKTNKIFPTQIKIGKTTIIQEKTVKLLGMTFDEKLGWNTHIHEKRGLISSLKSRLFLVKRLMNHLNHNALMKVVDGLFTSKLRYGLQLYGKVRRNDEYPMNADLAAIQKVQNKLVRIVNK